MGYCKYCMSEINDGSAFCPVCGKDLSKPEPVHHLQPGTVLAGRYTVGAALGEGGFGITYLGINNKLGLKVAIKEYFPFGYVQRVSSLSATVTEHTETDDDCIFEKGREKFLSEAKTLAKLYNQDGVVSVLDFFEENNTAYIVMEYLEGQTLKAYLGKKGRLSYDETLSLLMPVMKSLSKVHEKGLIHRDISPDNIMITADKVKLLDFGAARYADGGNKSLSVVLKHGYAPEEQYRRKGEQGPWTDVYALCATIYKCITGATPDESNERTIEDTIKKPSEYGADISPECEAALMKGLAVFAKNRYRSVNDLIKGLEGKDDSLAAAAEPEKKNANVIPPVTANDGEKTEALFDKKKPDPDKTVLGDAEPDPDKTVYGEDPDKTVFTNEPELKKKPEPAPVYKEKADKPKEKRGKKAIIIAIVALLVIGSIAGAVLAVVLKKDRTSGIVTKYNQTAATPDEYFDFELLNDGTYEIKAKDVNNMPAEVVIPSTYNGKPVTRIGDDAFCYCHSLTNITIPDNITSISDLAFSGCDALNYNSYDNALYLGNADNPYYMLIKAENRDITSIKIKETAKVITDYAFANCGDLKSVKIPDSVAIINAYAFAYCSNLTSVTIGNNVKTISYCVFRDCSSLTDITIPDSVTSISSSSFSGCDSLNYNNYDNAVYLGNNDNPYHALIKANNEDITSIKIKESAKVIADYAFSECRELTSVSIPDSVTNIGGSSFNGCSGLTNVTLGNSVVSIGESAFRNCRRLAEITIPDSVTSLCHGAFFSCSSLNSVKIGSGVESIGNFVFAGCGELENIEVSESNTRYHSAENCLIETESKTLIVGCKNSVIPDDGNVTSVGNYAFYGSYNLTDITIPDCITSIGDFAFLWCGKLKNVTIGSSVKSIGENAFYYCNELANLMIPGSVTSIGDRAFEGCSGLEKIEVSESNTVYHSDGNCLIETESKTLITGCNSSVMPIDDSVTCIGDGAFEGCSEITNITIPDSITSIGEASFYGCSSLTSIIIPDGVTSIGSFSFGDCYGLESITIPGGVTSISDGVFNQCWNLTSVSISSSITSLGVRAFQGCSRLESIYYSDTVEQWNSIEKASDWNSGTGNYTVHCTDGDIPKE